MKTSESIVNINNINVVGRPPKKKNLGYLFADEVNPNQNEDFNKNNDLDSNSNYEMQFNVKDNDVSPIKVRSEAGAYNFNSEQIDSIWSSEIQNGY